METSTDSATAQERLETAAAELETKREEVAEIAAEVVAEKIEDAQATAIDAAVSAESAHERINTVDDELRNREDADEWTRQQISEITLMLSTQNSQIESLLNRLALLETVATAPTPEPQETPTESDTTKTEALPNVAVESPAAVPPADIEPEPKKKRVRTV